MGTRADFYLGRGQDAEWLGSVAWDGYPDGIDLTLAEQEEMFPGGPMTSAHRPFPEAEHPFRAETEQQWRDAIRRYFEHRDDVSLPADGWPWPWNDSAATDFAYTFEDGKVYASCCGGPWVQMPCTDEEAFEDPPGDTAVFPDMQDRKRVRLSGPASGLTVIEITSGERSR